MRYRLVGVLALCTVAGYFSGCEASSMHSSNPASSAPGGPPAPGGPSSGGGSGGSGGGSGGSGGGSGGDSGGGGSTPSPAFGTGVGASGQNSAPQFLYGTQIPNGTSIPAKVNQQTGVLSAVTMTEPNPLPNFGANSAIDPSGNFLYQAARPGLFAYTINRETGALTQIADSPFSSAQSFDTVAVSQAGKFVYAYGDGQVFAYSIQTGTGQLTPVAGSPFPAALPTASNGFANRIAVDQKDKFLYVSTSIGIFGYNVVETTGALTLIPGSPFGTAPQPYAVLVIPSNQFLYESTLGTTSIYGYKVDQNTGVLTQVPGEPFNAGGQCGGVDNMTMAPQGKFLFENCGSMSVNPTTGALTLASNSVPGDWPVLDPAGRFLWAIISDQNCWQCNQGPVAYQVDTNTGHLTRVPNSFFVMQNDMTGAVVSLAITK